MQATYSLIIRYLGLERIAFDLLEQLYWQLEWLSRINGIDKDISLAVRHIRFHTRTPEHLAPVIFIAASVNQLNLVFLIVETFRCAICVPDRWDVLRAEFIYKESRHNARLADFTGALSQWSPYEQCKTINWLFLSLHYSILLALKYWIQSELQSQKTIMLFMFSNGWYWEQYNNYYGRIAHPNKTGDCRRRRRRQDLRPHQVHIALIEAIPLIGFPPTTSPLCSTTMLLQSRSTERWSTSVSGTLPAKNSTIDFGLSPIPTAMYSW